MSDFDSFGELGFDKNTMMVSLPDMLSLIASLMEHLAHHYEEAAETHRQRFIDYRDETNEDHAGALIGATTHFAKVEALLELMNSLIATIDATIPDLPLALPTYRQPTTLSVWLFELFGENVTPPEWSRIDVTPTPPHA
jgi:hypothetical protein